jgi:small-conductance mechanosensitive channel/CRP-like cAMP-binding protein
VTDEVLWALGLFAGVVVTAAAVNRFSPKHRGRLRRVVALYVVFVATLGLMFACRALHADLWAARFALATELLQALNVVNIGTTLAFSVALTVTGVAVPMIATDLMVGLGYIVATLGVLSGHGLNPTGAFASAAVVSAVVAISLQSTLGNVLGGVALQLDGSIREGDWIQLDGPVVRQGKVRAIRWRHTVVETRDWSTIIVPNSVLLAQNIVILGKREGREVPQRMWVWFNVDFRYPPSKVIAVVTEALRASPIEGVAADPPPNCVCMDFGRDLRESFATYAVRYWLTDLAHDDPTNSRVRARLFAALRRAGIPLALPAKQLFVEKDNDRRRVEKSEHRVLERLAALRNITLFQALTEGELRTLAEGMSHVLYANGELITRQGAVAHWLYVMTGGSAQVRTTIDIDGPGPVAPQSKVVAELTAPDFFGEMGLMTGEPRLADVGATSDVECFRLGKATFERVLLARPEIALLLSEKLATRRVELLAVRENLDMTAQKARHASERDRILEGIKSFFGLSRDSLT